MDVTVVGVLARPFEHDGDPATFSNQRAFQIAITQGDVVIDSIPIRPEHGGLGRDDDLIRAILALDRDVRDGPRCCVDFLRRYELRSLAVWTCTASLVCCERQAEKQTRTRSTRRSARRSSSAASSCIA